MEADQPWIATYAPSATTANLAVAYADIVPHILASDPPPTTRPRVSVATVADTTVNTATPILEPGGDQSPTATAFQENSTSTASRVATSRKGILWAVYQKPVGELFGELREVTYFINASRDNGQTWSSETTLAPGVAPYNFKYSFQGSTGIHSLAGINALRGGVLSITVDDNETAWIVYGARLDANLNDDYTAFDQLWLVSATLPPAPSNVITINNYYTPIRVSPTGTNAFLPAVAALRNGEIGVLYVTIGGSPDQSSPLTWMFSQKRSGSDVFDSTLLSTINTPSAFQIKHDSRALGDYVSLKATACTYFGGFPSQGWIPDNQFDIDPWFLKAAALPPLSGSPDCFEPGDVDGSHAIDIADVFYLINYFFAGGPAPLSGRTDLYCDGVVGVDDVFKLINFLFAGGSAVPIACQGAQNGTGSQGAAGAAAGAGPAAASVQDSIRIDQVVTTSGTGQVSVPVYITDNSGTLLDNANAPHQRIAGFTLKVQYGSTPGSPSPCVTQDFSAGNDSTAPPFIRGGILSNAFPSKFYAVAGTGVDASGTFTGNTDVTVIYLRNDGSTPALPGLTPNVEQLVGNLVFNLNGCPASVINLHVTNLPGTDETALQNDAPDIRPGLLQENAENGLAITDGSITVSLTPSISSISPGIGSTAGGASVTINGSNFVAGAAVSFGGAAATITSVTTSTITVTTPTHSYGPVSVTVTNPGGQVATAPTSYVYDNVPTAVLGVTPASGLTPLTATFSGASSSDPDTSSGDAIASYTFTFGDGSAPVTQASPMVSHTYTSDGVRTSTLVVTDSKGVSSSASPVTVTSATNNAQFLAQNVPTTMVKSHSYSATVSMKNTGTTTWGPTTYQLRSKNPTDNTTWGASRIASCTAPPGLSCIFTMNLTAPAQAGTYNFQWRMFDVTHNVELGDLTPNVVITVTNH
jgi:IPT/TIG domain-containing protein/PKD domain-containing protein/Ig-like domain-containing protein